MSTTASLYQLQELDNGIEKARRRLEELERLLADDAALVAAQTRADADRKEATDTESRLRRSNDELTDLSAKIELDEKRLYSGRILNPKELRQLQEELDHMKQRRAGLEDATLELMMRVEEARTAARAAAADLEKERAYFERQHASLSTERDALRNELAGMEQQRAALAVSLPGGAVATYEQIRKHKGAAVVKVDKGVCGGCRLTVPPGHLAKVRSSSTPLQCGNCGRILYVER